MCLVVYENVYCFVRNPSDKTSRRGQNGPRVLPQPPYRERTRMHTHSHTYTHTHEHSLSVTPQEMVQDPEYEHLKLEKKCCDQGCLAGGLLFDPSLRPIVSKAKRLKTEAGWRPSWIV